MITLHGEEVKVGDKVWHWVRGWGEVAWLDEGSTNYPIFVRWGEEDCGWFSKDGEFHTRDKIPVLFWQPIEFEMPKKPKQKEKAWQWVYRDDAGKYMITYMHYTEGKEVLEYFPNAEQIEPYLPSEIERIKEN